MSMPDASATADDTKSESSHQEPPFPSSPYTTNSTVSTWSDDHATERFRKLQSGIRALEISDAVVGGDTNGRKGPVDGVALMEKSLGKIRRKFHSSESVFQQQENGDTAASGNGASIGTLRRQNSRRRRIKSMSFSHHNTAARMAEQQQQLSQQQHDTFNLQDANYDDEETSFGEFPDDWDDTNQTEAATEAVAPSGMTGSQSHNEAESINVQSNNNHETPGLHSYDKNEMKNHSGKQQQDASLGEFHTDASVQALDSDMALYVRNYVRNLSMRQSQQQQCLPLGLSFNEELSNDDDDEMGVSATSSRNHFSNPQRFYELLAEQVRSSKLDPSLTSSNHQQQHATSSSETSHQHELILFSHHLMNQVQFLKDRLKNQEEICSQYEERMQNNNPKRPMSKRRKKKRKSSFAATGGASRKRPSIVTRGGRFNSSSDLRRPHSASSVFASTSQSIPTQFRQRNMQQLQRMHQKRKSAIQRANQLQRYSARFLGERAGKVHVNILDYVKQKIRAVLVGHSTRQRLYKQKSAAILIQYHWRRYRKQEALKKADKKETTQFSDDGFS